MSTESLNRIEDCEKEIAEILVYRNLEQRIPWKNNPMVWNPNPLKP
jgi:hypothetical protein